jgi:adenylosuccinate lyase
MENNSSDNSRHLRSIYRNLSPLDHRYYLSNQTVFDRLSDYLSEEASIKYCLLVESALLKTHIQYFLENDPELVADADNIVESINPTEVYAEEEKTQHNIRALVNVINSKLSKKLIPYVHLGATSVDILDTAASLKIRDAVKQVILPELIGLEKLLADLAVKEAATIQVGRTHGQHAVPVTFGYAVAEYVSRLGKSIGEIHAHADNLRGKLAGAVGSYNALGIINKDPKEFEAVFLGFLGLRASEHCTQLIEPEYLLRLLLEINTAFGIVANLADDFRNLQRTEIAEISEMFTSKQVGSSTMPQKRNPWNSEHVKSLWKAFSPRVMAFYADQISEHQRDLSNSASSRFVADYLAGFTAAITRIKKVVATLYVHTDTMQKNLKFTGDAILAEPAYILLSLAGETDAHETVRKLTLECESTGASLFEVLKKNKSLWDKVSTQLSQNTGINAEVFFENPELYHGLAPERAREIGRIYLEKMEKMSKELSTGR